jgi:hypothetical protein
VHTLPHLAHVVLINPPLRKRHAQLLTLPHVPAIDAAQDGDVFFGDAV